MLSESALLPNRHISAKPQDAGASDGPKLAHANEQPELPDTRSQTGNPPFMRRCLTAALQLYGLTHRELFAYAVLVSHCRAYVDGEAGSCRLLYLTWATETGVLKPIQRETPQTPEATKKRLKSGATRDEKHRKPTQRSSLTPGPKADSSVRSDRISTWPDRGKSPLSR